jgi:CRISPR/Cas system-associated endonuclease Cas1
LIAEGHATAARVVREAEAQQRADMSRLEQEKALIEHSIQELRSFEREYRIKLKSYIESQLEELEQSEGPTTSTGSTPAIEQNFYNPGFNAEPEAPKNPFNGDFGFSN